VKDLAGMKKTAMFAGGMSRGKDDKNGCRQGVRDRTTVLEQKKTQEGNVVDLKGKKKKRERAVIRIDRIRNGRMKRREKLAEKLSYNGGR